MTYVENRLVVDGMRVMGCVNRRHFSTVLVSLRVAVSLMVLLFDTAADMVCEAVSVAVTLHVALGVTIAVTVDSIVGDGDSDIDNAGFVCDREVDGGEVTE